MLSYAQNFEDVILSRALKEIRDGFYVDVGAWHPSSDSVTRHFYDGGWRGVNIEPNPAYLALLQKERPRDVNLGVALGARKGKAKFHIFQDTGLSTLDRSIATSHRRGGFAEEEITIDVVSLNSVFEAHAPPTVHFLKIDCEGAEAKVINAFNMKRFRPWIVLVEATRPLSQDETHLAWEPHIVEAGFQPVYFDGLNRFYLAEEKSDLKSAFLTPPNVFDGFVVAHHAEVSADRDRLKDELARVAAERDGFMQAIAKLTAERDDLLAQLSK